MPPSSEIERELHQIETELRRLETEYNMYFAGRLHRPPWETRSRVVKAFKRLDRTHIPNYADRFRFTTLQTRLATFLDLWDRAQRARDEGRPGPFGVRPAPPDREETPPSSRVLHVVTFDDPGHETDKLEDLYERLAEARRAAGEHAVPFHKFARLVQQQVGELRRQGSAEVAVRVTVQDGRVSVTARALKSVEPTKGIGDGEDE